MAEVPAGGYLTPTEGAASGGRWGRSLSKEGAGAHPPIPEEYSDSEEDEGASLSRGVSGSGAGGARITSVLPDGSRLPCATALEVERRNYPRRGQGPGEEEGGGEDQVSATYRQQLRVAAEEEAPAWGVHAEVRGGGGRMHRYTNTHTHTHAHMSACVSTCGGANAMPARTTARTTARTANTNIAPAESPPHLTCSPDLMFCHDINDYLFITISMPIRHQIHAYSSPNS